MNSFLNSLPLSISISFGCGYCANQTVSKICCTWYAVGVPYNWQHLNHPVTGSTIVSTCSWYSKLFLFEIVFGSNRSTLTLLHFVISPFFSGRRPYLFLLVFLDIIGIPCTACNIARNWLLFLSNKTRDVSLNTFVLFQDEQVFYDTNRACVNKPILAPKFCHVCVSIRFPQLPCMSNPLSSS